MKASVSKGLFGVISDDSGDYDRRSATATGVPETQDLNLLIANSIVEVVTESCEVQTSHPSGTGVCDWCTNAGFHAQQGKCLSEVFVEGAWRKRSMLVPP